MYDDGRRQVSILQGQISWLGFPGAPGYTVLHTRNSGVITTAVDNMVSALDALATAFAGVVGNNTTLRASQLVEEYDEATGVLQAQYTSPVVVTDHTGASGQMGPGVSGACISWKTAGVVAGRPVRGRTFVVPIAAAAYDASGTLTSAVLTGLNAAATAYRTSATIETVIWHRAKNGAGGAAFDITASSIKDQAAVLRSRRN